MDDPGGRGGCLKTKMHVLLYNLATVTSLSNNVPLVDVTGMSTKQNFHILVTLVLIFKIIITYSEILEVY